MHIVVVDVPADSGGALSILTDFFNYVKLHGQEHRWTFIVSTPQFEECDHVKVKRLPWIRKNMLNRLKWEYLFAAKQINELKADLVFSLQNLTIPYLKLPQVVYVHQPLPFQNVKKYSFLKKEERSMAFYQHIVGSLIKKGIRNADRVIVQTEWMKDSIVRTTKIKSDKVAVIAPEVDIPKNKKTSFRDGKPVQHNVFFYPASPLPYKNHKCILNAARILLSKGVNNFTIEFTLKGNENEIAASILKEAKEMDGNIKLIGYLTRDQVYDKLIKSVLLFPSYIETFGLPLLEARELGSIILASNCSFSNEILMGYPNKRFFNPFNAFELANEMEKIINGEWNYSAENVKIMNYSKNGWKSVLEILNETVESKNLI